MNKKQIILITVVPILSMTLLFFIFYTIFKIDPTILGLPKQQATIEKDYPVEVSSKKLRELEQNMILKKKLTQQYDSLKNAKKILEDSLKSIKNELEVLTDTTKKFFDIMAQKDLITKRNSDSVEFLNSYLNRAKNEINILKTKLAETEKSLKSKRDSIQIQHYRSFAKIYNNAKPADVARILEKIDERDASQILKFMDQKKAGKVIEALDPKIASAILLLSN